MIQQQLMSANAKRQALLEENRGLHQAVSRLHKGLKQLVACIQDEQDNGPLCEASMEAAELVEEFKR